MKLNVTELRDGITSLHGIHVYLAAVYKQKRKYPFRIKQNYAPIL